MIMKLKKLYGEVVIKSTSVLQSFVLLGFRWQIGCVFLLSGMTKWMGFLHFNPVTYDIFLYEFFCPEEKRPGALFLCDEASMDYLEGSLMVPFVELLALMSGVLEIVLPILLFLGLFTRLAALGILAMVLFIQLAVFPDWSHWVNPASWWFGFTAVLVAFGPGVFSLDRLLGIEKNSSTPSN